MITSRSLCVVGSVLLVIGFLVASKTAGAQASPASIDKEIDLTDVKAVWKKVLEVNGVWLDPKPVNLSYTLTMDRPKSDFSRNACHRVYHVWLAGDNGRVESESQGEREPTLAKLSLVFSGNRGVAFEPTKYLLESPLQIDLRTFRQGTAWHTGINWIVQYGIPENTRIVDDYDMPDGKVIVIEMSFDCQDNYILAGLGIWEIYRLNYGRVMGSIERMYLHINTASFTPIREVDYMKVYHQEDNYRYAEFYYISTIEFGSQFIAFGPQLAPSTIQCHQKNSEPVPTEPIPIDRILTFEFQKVGNVWILKKGQYLYGGILGGQIVSSNISFQPPDPALLTMPSADELRRLKAPHWPIE